MLLKFFSLHIFLWKGSGYFLSNFLPLRWAQQHIRSISMWSWIRPDHSISSRIMAKILNSLFFVLYLFPYIFIMQQYLKIDHLRRLLILDIYLKMQGFAFPCLPICFIPTQSGDCINTIFSCHHISLSIDLGSSRHMKRE